MLAVPFLAFHWICSPTKIQKILRPYIFTIDWNIYTHTQKGRSLYQNERVKGVHWVDILCIALVTCSVSNVAQICQWTDTLVILLYSSSYLRFYTHLFTPVKDPKVLKMGLNRLPIHYFSYCSSLINFPVRNVVYIYLID